MQEAKSAIRGFTWIMAMLLGSTVGGALLPTSAGVDEKRAQANSQLGSYLAGRIARGMHDTAAAAAHYERALRNDTSNVALIGRCRNTVTSP